MFSLSCDIEHAVAQPSMSCEERRPLWCNTRSLLRLRMIRFGRDGSASEKMEDVHNVENFVLCSFAHHVCRPLLQGGVQEEELCSVALTCHFALNVTFCMRGLNSGGCVLELGGVVVFFES